MIKKVSVYFSEKKKSLYVILITFKIVVKSIDYIVSLDHVENCEILFNHTFFFTKRNDIRSFKLIEYIDTMKIAKNKKDESASMLIA